MHVIRWVTARSMGSGKEGKESKVTGRRGQEKREEGQQPEQIGQQLGLVRTTLLTTMAAATAWTAMA